MSMNATMQVRMDDTLKTQAEALYAEMGTSFAEAIRMFAKQSILVGGFPFRPALKTWDEFTVEDIDARLSLSEDDIHQGRLYSQSAVDALVKERLSRG